MRTPTRPDFRPQYRELEEGERFAITHVKNCAATLAVAIENGYEGSLCIEPRQQALAYTLLEQSVMHAVKGLTGPIDPDFEVKPARVDREVPAPAPKPDGPLTPGDEGYIAPLADGPMTHALTVRHREDVAGHLEAAIGKCPHRDPDTDGLCNSVWLYSSEAAAEDRRARVLLLRTIPSIGESGIDGTSVEKIHVETGGAPV